MHECQEESKKGTSNFLDETIYSIVVFKIYVFFIMLKEELPNNSTSKIPESFRFKMLLSMFRMLFMRINLSSATNLRTKLKNFCTDSIIAKNLHLPGLEEKHFSYIN